MNLKALFVGSIGVLLLAGIVVEYTPGAISPATSSSPKNAAVPSPLTLAPTTTPPSAVPSSPPDPLAARDDGYRQITAFQSAGEFDRAAEFALGGPADVRRDWLIAAYHQWGRLHPDRAFTVASQILDPAARQIALESVFSGWARTDPKGLAELALDRPDGPEKDAALTKAMRAWIHEDPWKAGDWIAAHQDVAPLVEAMFRHDER